MYKITGTTPDGEITIYDDNWATGAVNALSPRLSLADNSAGSLEITLPPGNPGYDTLERLVSELRVYQDGDEIWSGRILREKKDFWNNRALTCEGALAYLNDSIQTNGENQTGANPAIHNGESALEFLTAILKQHNDAVGQDSFKRIELGAVDLTSRPLDNEGTDDKSVISVFCVTDGVNSLEAIKQNLVNKFGGHMRVKRNSAGINELEYYKDYPGGSSQVIRFGQNLLDFTKEWDATDIVTRVIPRGAALDNKITVQQHGGQPDENGIITGADDNPSLELQTYVTAEPVNAPQELTDKYGIVEQVVEWPDITDAEELKAAAEKYVTELQFDNMVIEVNAVDLRYLGASETAMKLYDTVRCVSKPHGLDDRFAVSEMTIYLDKPDNSTYTLKKSKTVGSVSASGKPGQTQQYIKNISDNYLTPNSALKMAMDNASKMIKSATHGVVSIMTSKDGAEFIDIVKDRGAFETYDEKKGTYTATDSNGKPNTKLWRWNINGLAFSTDGANSFKDIAITSDGQISANAITTGVLRAIKIEGPEVEVPIMKGDGTDSGVTTNIKSAEWDLGSDKDHKNEGIKMSHGSISIGPVYYSDEKVRYNFSVNERGELWAQYGKIGGFTITADELSNDGMTLNSDGLHLFRGDDKCIGRIGGSYWDENPSYKAIAMNLENGESGIWWGYRVKASDDIYTIKLMYAAKAFAACRADTLNVGCALDMHGNEIQNCVIDPDDITVTNGLTNSSFYLLAKSTGSDGQTTYAPRAIKIKNGFIVAR